jgi:hypothetical protein
MSLSILVIGRGVDERNLPNCTHQFNFIKRAKSNSQIISVSDFNFVFQHLGIANPEASAAITHWQSIGEGTKLITFGGGQLPNEFRDLKLPYLERLATKEDFLNLNWKAVPSNFSGSVEELLIILRESPKEVSLALLILCQGYLAVHCDSSFYKNLEKSVKDLLGNVSQKAQDTEKSKWWKVPFKDETQKTLTEKIAQEWQPQDLPKEIIKLIEAIYSNPSIKDMSMVEKAYKPIKDRLI